MFNVRPDALSPWLYVEQPPADEPPGFRVAPDGQSGAPPFSSFGFDPGVGTAPSAGTDFEDSIRRAAGLYGPADLAMLRRNPIQEALDQIARIYRGFGARPSNVLDRQGPGTGLVAPVGSRPLSPYAAASSLWQAAEPSVPFNPVRHVEGDYLPMGEGPFSFPSGDLTQLDPGLAPPPAPESLRAPDDQGSPLPWLQPNLPSQLNAEPLLERRSPDPEPVSLPASATSVANPSAAFDAGTGTIPANNVQIAQAPRPQQRQNPSASPKQQRPEPSASEQQFQVKATQRLNTRLERTSTWDDLIRRPLPEKIDPRFQQPLPDDWEAAVTKKDPNYLKWTKAAAEKYGIPPELLARLIYKESTYDRNQVSGRGAKGIAQLTPKAVEDLGFDPKTFDYFNAEKSINASAALLGKYYRHFKDWPKTVAAYNWGIGNLHNWLEGDKPVGPGDETETTLKHVFRGNPRAFNKGP